MSPLPSANVMYRALTARDTTFDGAFFAAIRTTGVFCRPGCGARKPNRENVEFFPTVGEALHAGYRPCLRCRPLDGAAKPPAWVQQALDLAEDSLDRRVTSGELRDHGIEPSRVTRYFKSHYGMTFQAYHRARRIGLALRHVRDGAPVLREAVGRGFESESGFRDAFIRMFGAAPTKVVSDDNHVLHARWLPTPLGPLLAVASERGVCLLEYVDRRALQSQIATLRRRVEGVVVPGNNAVLDRLADELRRYFDGTLSTFTVTLHAPGTPFQQNVWDELRRIPFGQTRSYSEIARRIGQPSAVRAVARANGDNRVAILIPCHRVIGADGSPTGYGGGLWRKQWLLDHERSMSSAYNRAEQARTTA